MFDHEKLDVYRLSLAFVSWAYRLCRALKGVDRHARDQLIRASQSIPLNIAEGNGKLPSPDRTGMQMRDEGIEYGCEDEDEDEDEEKQEGEPGGAASGGRVRGLQG